MERVLLIRVSALGDVILVEPVIRALRTLHEGVEVHLITNRRFQPLLERFGADAVFPYDYRGADTGLSGIRHVLKRLPQGRYDAVIDLQGKLRTRLLAKSIPADRQLVLEKRRPIQALLSLLGHDPPIDDQHTTSLYLSVLEPLGFQETDFDRRPRFDLQAQKEGRIGLVPGATHDTKRWPEDRFARLAEALHRERGATIVLIGGPTERPLLDTIRAQAESAVFDPRDVTMLDPLGLAELIAELDLVVSVDSGPAHLAAALSVPTVVLFGPTSHRRWGPIGDLHRIVSLNLSCAPCSNMGAARCPLPDASHACMKELDLSLVLSACRSMS